MNRLFTIMFITIILISLCSNIAFSQFSKRKTTEPMRYAAERMEGKKVEEEHIREYFDNVQMNQGDVQINCNYAIQYFSNNSAVLTGNVVLTQRGLKIVSPKIFYNGDNKLSRANNGVSLRHNNTYLTADSGRYSGLDEIAVFQGNVVIDDDSSTIFSNYALHERKSENSYAYGKALILSKVSNSSLAADTIEYFPKQYLTIAKGSPLLQQIDTVETLKNDSIEYRFDSLLISSKYMKAVREPKNEIYYFVDSVSIIRGSVKAICGYAEYKKSKDTILLTQKPVLWLDSTQLTGDTITISLLNNKIKQIHAKNLAISGFRENEDFPDMISQIVGNDIFINFSADTIETIISKGDAKSLYFIIDEDGAVDAQQNTSEEIIIEMSDNETDKVYWIHSVTGSVFPHNQVFHQPKEYYLPNFKWFINRPLPFDFPIQRSENYVKMLRAKTLLD